MQKGTKRAATLGFPTVNIPLSDAEVRGIYVARVVSDGKEYFAAAFADHDRKVLEAYLLDFSDTVYGKEVTIELLEKIRDSEKFGDNATLRAMIASDVAKVREYFKN